MHEKWRKTPIVGVWRRRLESVADKRGTFAELWRASDTMPEAVPGMVQANLSRSRAGAVRGLHFHLRQWDLWTVLDGRAQVALIDIRPRLANNGARLPVALVATFEPGEIALIPPGVAHGFWALEATDLMYLVSREYDGRDEHGFAWNDHEAGIEWPPGSPLLSERDAAAGSLADAVAAAPQAGQISDR